MSKPKSIPPIVDTMARKYVLYTFGKVNPNLRPGIFALMESTRYQASCRNAPV